MKLAYNAFTFPSRLGACAGSADLEVGRKIHEHVLGVGLGSYLYIKISMSNMYVRIGSLNEAGKMFDGMRHRDIASPGYSVHEEREKTVEVYGHHIYWLDSRLFYRGGCLVGL